MNLTLKKRLIKFYEEVGEKYPEEEKVYKTLRGILRKKFVLEYLKNFEGPFLDVGCNTGVYLREFSNGLAFGIDLSFNSMTRIPSLDYAQLAVADAERLFCFRKNSFRSLLCSEVIEHCLDPQAVFAGIAHVLRPGGKALITTPNYRKKRPDWIDLGELRWYDITSDCNDRYFHTAYRPEELLRFAHQANLSVLQVGTLEKEVKYATKIPVIILLVGRFLNRIFRSKKFDKLNQEFFEWSSRFVYKLCDLLGVNALLTALVKRGVRSYILVSKPKR